MPADLAARAKAEKYCQILSKTIINPDGENFAQNQYFYDAAEGVLTAVILLLAEYLPPREIDGVLRERRHIVSVFKLVQELLAPSILPGKNEFQLLMDRLPEEHKAKLVLRLRPHRRRAVYGLRHVHRPLPAEHLPGLGAGASAVFRQHHQTPRALPQRNPPSSRYFRRKK